MLHSDGFIFEVLEEFNVPENLRKHTLKTMVVLLLREDYYIHKYNSVEKGYNIEYTLDKIKAGKKPVIKGNTNVDVNTAGLALINRGKYLQSDSYTNEMGIRFLKTNQYHNRKQSERKPKPKKEKVVKPKIPKPDSLNQVLQKLPESFTEKYAPNIFYYIFQDLGYITQDGYGKRFYLTDLGIKSGLFITDVKTVSPTQQGIDFIYQHLNCMDDYIKEHDYILIQLSTKQYTILC